MFFDISPKLIAVDGNRIEYTDNKFILHLEKYKGGYGFDSDGKSMFGLEKNKKIYGDSNGRFPTQLFTNIEHEQFKYCKKINKMI